MGPYILYLLNTFIQNLAGMLIEGKCTFDEQKINLKTFLSIRGHQIVRV
jgi:hypothetical protein